MYIVKSLMKASEEAQEWAESLTIGDTFVGAATEAVWRGYRRDTPEYRLFVNVSMIYLPQTIETDRNGTITDLARAPIDIERFNQIAAHFNR